MSSSIAFQFTELTKRETNGNRKLMNNLCSSTNANVNVNMVELAKIHPSACKAENQQLNRYNNILPIESSRIVLNPPTKNYPKSDYVNANLVTLRDLGYGESFIMSQAPTPIAFETFWSMIWQQKVGVILSLNKLIEGGHRKGDVYWPVHQKTVNFGRISVTLVAERTISPCITIRHLSIKNLEECDQLERNLYQVHYLGWPDFGIPESTYDIRELILIVDYLKSNVLMMHDECGPMVVHCSAGVGRTGSFVGLKYILSSEVFNRLKSGDFLRMTEESNWDVENNEGDLIEALSAFKISDIVVSMRQQRNTGTVQTVKQFELIFKTIKDELLNPIDANLINEKITSAFPIDESPSVSSEIFTSSDSDYEEDYVLRILDPCGAQFNKREGVVNIRQMFTATLNTAQQ